MSTHEGNELRLYLRKKGIKQEDLSMKIGISRSTLLNYLNLGELPEEFKQMLKKANINWANVETNDNTSEPLIEYKPSGPTILHVPIEAEAGFVGGSTDPIMNEDLQVWSMPGFDEPGYSFRVKGDSMYPTFKEGEIVITSRKIEPYDLIRKQYIYVIVTETNILIKRVEADKKKQGVLRLISDNSKHEAIEVNYDDVKIYKARRNFTWDLSKKYDNE